MPPPWPKDKNCFSSNELLPYWNYSITQDFHCPTNPNAVATYAPNHPQTWNTDEKDKLTFKQDVASLSVNADGTLLALAVGTDIRIHATHDRHEIQVLKGHTASVEAVAWSPTDPKVLVSSGKVRERHEDMGREMQVLVWNIDDQAQRCVFNGAIIHQLARQAVLNLDQDILDIAPEGRWALSRSEREALTSDLAASLTRSHARYLVSSSMRFPGRILDPLSAAPFSPDGQSFLYLPTIDRGSWNTRPMNIHVHDLSNNRTRQILHGHRESIIWARYNPSGTLIGTASFDGTFRIYTAADGQTKYIFEPPNKPQNWSAGFSPDGRFFAGTSGTGIFYVWGLDKGQLLAEFNFVVGGRDHAWCRTLDWSADSKYLAVSGQMCTIMVVEPLAIHPERRVVQERRLSTSACDEGVRNTMSTFLETTRIAFLPAKPDLGNEQRQSEPHHRLAFKMAGDRGLEVYDFVTNEKMRFAPPPTPEDVETLPNAVVETDTPQDDVKEEPLDGDVEMDIHQQVELKVPHASSPAAGAQDINIRVEEDVEVQQEDGGWGPFTYCPLQGMLASVDGRVVRFWKV